MTKNVCRTFVSVALASIVAVPGVALASTEFDSLLDGMSASELEALQDEVSSRLEEAKSGGKTSDVSNDYGVWKLNYYTDEFGRQEESPENAFIVSDTSNHAINGEFSNSITTNGECEFVVFIHFSSRGTPVVAIRMIEYGDLIVKSSYDSKSYSVAVLDKNGNRYSGEGVILEGDDAMFPSFDEVHLIDLLLQGGPISFSIEERGEYAASSYRFTIEDTSGLSNALAYFGYSAGEDTPATNETSVSYVDGTYEGVGKGIGGDVPVSVTIEDGVISSVIVGNNSETQGIGSKAIEQLPGAIVEANGTYGVDTVAGATATSLAIFSAVEEALGKAQG